MNHFLILAFLINLCTCDVRVGDAVNIFRFYGNLGVLTRARQDDNWVLPEGVVDIFDEVLETRSSPVPSGELFTGDFRMEFCDNLSQLLEAFFKRYQVEGTEKPWRAFTRGWSIHTMAKQLGLNDTYVRTEHSYVLVRLSRFRESIRLSQEAEMKLNNWTMQRINRLKVGDVLSVMDFMQELGSHYVESYTSGNSLYQILAYKTEVYHQMKHDMMRYGVNALRVGEPNGYLTPSYAEHMGLILSAGGNAALETWAEKNLHSTMYVFVYSSLLKLQSSPELLQELNSLLGPQALIELKLKSLAPIFKDVEKRHWFEEVMNNHLRLWELSA